jgi:ABC-type transport system involved in cytochrome bd biosynthesis fused ATPase/permease subunit
MKQENILKNIIKCYKAFSFFNPTLNFWIILQTFILILSRSFVALFSLGLSYFINKITNITILETITISVVSFYCFNRMLEWVISAIHGRFHTQFVLPSALNFVDQIIYMMLRNHSHLKLNKNPVELASLLNKKTDARGFLGFLFHHISTPILELIVCAVLLVSMGFGWLGFFLIPVCFIYLGISMKLLPKIKNKLMEVLSISARTSGVFSSSLEKSSLATSFGTIDTLVDHLKEVTQKESLEFKRSALLNDFMATLLNLPLALFACLFFYFGSIQVEQGLTSYGGFAALISIIMNSFSQLKNLTFAFDGLSNSLTALKLHLDIFEKCRNIKNETKEKLNIESFNKLTLNNLQVNIQNKTLFNINLNLNKGEKIFVVGNSGTGKTSLIRALLGYQDYSGEILINDKPIDLMQFPFAWMPQEYQAIEGTVRFNLSLGNPNATDEEMSDILKHVNLYDKVISIGGLDANLAYQGNNLSGGENQRLSLARCLLSDNPIMLLDEPSSALDMALERSIFEHLVKSEKSGLVIVHRLKAIPQKSKVLFMQDNQIFTVDYLENLIINNENFKKLYLSNEVNK